MKPTTEADIEAMNHLLNHFRELVTVVSKELLDHVERLRSGVLAMSLGQPGLKWGDDAQWGEPDEEMPGVSRITDARRRRGSGDLSRMSRLNHPAGKR